MMKIRVFIEIIVFYSINRNCTHQLMHVPVKYLKMIKIDVFYLK